MQQKILKTVLKKFLNARNYTKEARLHVNITEDI